MTRPPLPFRPALPQTHRDPGGEARVCRSGTLLAACAVLLAVAGCVPLPTGPILGDWRGTPPGPSVEQPKIVELVLDGAPDATSDRYHIAITVQNTRNGAGAGTTHWQGDWTGSQQTLDGHSARIIDLHDMVDGQNNRYELASDGSLRPVTGTNSLAATYSPAQVALYTLRPLPRDSWNYGVD